MTSEEKKFVDNQHKLAFEHFRQQEYDLAIYEGEKILKLIPEYKDTSDIVRLSKIGKAHLEALKEEEKREEEERKVKERVEALVSEISVFMNKKDYAKARDLFGEVLTLDPEHPQVTAWKKEIDDFDEAQRLADQEKKVQEEINHRAQGILVEAENLKKAGKCLEAISIYSQVSEIGTTNPKLLQAMEKGKASCQAWIRGRLEPLLAEARELESQGEFAKAFQLFEKASQVDPRNSAGRKGMERIRGILHDKSKALYTEAVIAESYSDFVVAEAKFKEIMSTAPRDDIYFLRAERKLAPYVRARGPAGLGGKDK